MAIDRFQGGRFNSSTYICRMCNKRTRETGHSESGAELCKKCFVTASQQNSHSDNAHPGRFDSCAECLEYCADCGVKVPKGVAWCDNVEVPA